LAAPKGDGTRPTTDRVREAAFQLVVDWAGAAGEPPETALVGLGFLDLFAGSGAVALEAASRGASPVWAVESDRRAADVIQANARITGLNVKVLRRKVEGLASNGATPGAFDIVWADPPYAMPNAVLLGTLAELAEAGWFAPDALVILERSSRDEPPVWPVGMREHSRRGYGETTLYLAVANSGAMPEPSEN
jgi:16S rRNA (guanine966-N2)-methyltransferase